MVKGRVLTQFYHKVTPNFSAFTYHSIFVQLFTSSGIPKANKTGVISPSPFRGRVLSGRLVLGVPLEANSNILFSRGPLYAHTIQMASRASSGSILGTDQRISYTWFRLGSRYCMATTNNVRRSFRPLAYLSNGFCNGSRFPYRRYRVIHDPFNATKQTT